VPLVSISVMEANNKNIDNAKAKRFISVNRFVNNKLNPVIANKTGINTLPKSKISNCVKIKMLLPAKNKTQPKKMPVLNCLRNEL